MTSSKQDEYTNEKSEAKHLDRVETDLTSAENDNWLRVTDDARQATAAEHSLTFLQAIKGYYKAVGWSIAVSMALVMEGYDTALIGTFYAYPTFQRQYGKPYNGGYQLAAPWQIGLTLGALVGEMFGIFANGYLTERFGHKRVLLVCYVLITLFIFIPFFSPTSAVLLVGEILCGLPWGVFSTAAPVGLQSLKLTNGRHMLRRFALSPFVAILQHLSISPGLLVNLFPQVYWTV